MWIRGLLLMLLIASSHAQVKPAVANGAKLTRFSEVHPEAPFAKQMVRCGWDVRHLEQDPDRGEISIGKESF